MKACFAVGNVLYASPSPPCEQGLTGWLFTVLRVRTAWWVGHPLLSMTCVDSSPSMIPFPCVKTVEGSRSPLAAYGEGLVHPDGELVLLRSLKPSTEGVSNAGVVARHANTPR